MERAQVDWTVPSIHHEKLRTRGHEVNTDEGSNMKLPGQVSDKLEKPVPQFFEVAEPFGSWQYPRLRLSIFYGFGDDLCLNGSQHLFQSGSQGARGDRCHIKVIRWRGWIGWWGYILWNQ